MKEEYDEDIEEEDENEDDRVSLVDHGRNNPHGRRNGRGLVHNQWGKGVYRNLGNIRLHILAFQDRNDPKAYLEWDKKMGLIHDCHNYLKEKKVKFTLIW